MSPKSLGCGQSHSRRGGFTLIELLTVIAIIGILAAIIIPVVGSVRAKAKSATCVSNLRQIGIALNLYAAANRNMLPAAYDSSITGSWWTKRWEWAIQSYLEDRKAAQHTDALSAVFDGVFRCPSKPNFDLAGPSDVERQSYGMNAFNNGASGASKARGIASFSQPSNVMLVIDTNTGSPSIYNGDIVNGAAYGARWHQERDNVLFADGHVAALARGELNYYLVKNTDNEVRP